MESFIKLAHDRYSVRKYRDTPVEEEKIRLILEAGRIAPTARNYQPVVIYAIESKEIRERMKEATPCTFDAPLIFVVCYDENTVSHGDIYEGFNFGQVDSSIACTHMMLEATDLGLGTCWVGKFVEADVKRVLNLTDNLRAVAILPTGYAADDSVPSPRHADVKDEKETVVRL